jgi:sortase A
MTDTKGPVIIKHPAPASFVKPGLHSHNSGRRGSQAGGKLGFLRGVRGLFLMIGLCGICYYGYTLSDEFVYQAYENWAFDQQIAGRAGVTFADYVREQTPFGFLVGAAPAKPAVSSSTRTAPGVPGEPAIPRPAEGSLLGRVEIGRLNISAIVREGVDAKTLSNAVGHVPSTALPGQLGNFAIAAHRDTLFRGLKDIRKDDLVTFQSPAGTYSYKVVATKIVTPSDVSVLRSDGGGIIPEAAPGQADSSHLLTMITCYPFYYVGAAPKRFIVEAELVPNTKAAPVS